ncbi:rhodanese-like domain-containing protein [Nibribacter ruber]|uniref:Rhodanese-like domain-containing protein n=1 Tax=Nibribacter ruber TaxID=2698458 RepID=A0A6P1NT33_9BACT|nr:rhodanese-like domain-containing protein [Nibribacter ruber]QHL86877.1 rhodanese-like domain-containing protein [Nibribacter ruber]
MENRTASDLVTEAKKNVENLSPDQVERELAQGNATLIDIRESEELKESGKIAGSTHAPRGMLEFLADDTTPYHKPEFDRKKRLILHCAGGGRSALAATTLKQMGYTNVAHLDGGLKAWKEAGKPLEQ